MNLSEKILYMKRALIHSLSHLRFWYWVKRLIIGNFLQGMEAGLGSITHTVNNNGSNGSGDLKETFIRKRISSPNPISKGKANNKSG